MIPSEPGHPAASVSNLVIRPYPTQYVRAWNLADGTPVTIRPIRPEDEPLMIDFHTSLSEETMHLRYFGFLNAEALITHERLARICFSDYDREIALVVERIEPAPDQRQIIAVARLIKDPELMKAATRTDYRVVDPVRVVHFGSCRTGCRTGPKS
jgi:acetyltransferase